jgi:ribosomal protein S27AE
LIAEHVLAARCANCGLAQWLGEAIPLELDHVDGDRENNELTNLRIVCPNCHALTPTYRGRNKRLKMARHLTHD